jgi:hypothetical protein
MPIDPINILGQIEQAVGLMPAAVLVIVLLTGPTLVWLLYRFVVQPHTRRYADDSVDVFWVCEDCRSVNDVRVSKCYLCGLERDMTMAGGVRVLDAGGTVLLAPDAAEPAPIAAAMSVPPVEVSTSRELVAVGPGPAGPSPATAASMASPARKASHSKASRRAPVPVMAPEEPMPVAAAPAATKRAAATRSSAKRTAPAPQASESMTAEAPTAAPALPASAPAVPDPAASAASVPAARKRRRPATPDVAEPGA